MDLISIKFPPTLDLNEIRRGELFKYQNSRPLTDLFSAKKAFTEDIKYNLIPTGQIAVKGSYDDKSKCLSITITDIKNVPSLPISSSIQLKIYVLVTLLPDMSQKKSSEILVDFPDCDINLVFTFEHISYQYIFEKSLSIKILNFEDTPQRIIFSECLIFLSEFDFVEEDEITRYVIPSLTWRNGALTFRRIGTDFGNIQIAFKYDLFSEEIHMRIIECSDLRIESYQNIPGIFVKTIFSSKIKKTQQKTKLFKKSANPFFNEEMIFELPLAEYHTSSIEFQICVSLSSFSTDIIAYTIIGPESSGIIKTPYTNALQNLGQWSLAKISLESAIYRQN
uniref:Synaptotagmin-4 (Trinotate prediction) n=1 Tax=Henneguya salminicola TaxID=69463 RepID=A0A6G3MDZ0_HENSL